MFDLLKKKIGGFIDTLTGKGAEKPAEKPAEKVPEPAREEGREEPVRKIHHIPEPRHEPKPATAPQPAAIPETKPIPKTGFKPEPKPQPKIEIKPAPELKPVPKHEPKFVARPIPKVEPKPLPPIQAKPAAEKKGEHKVKIDLLKQVTSVFTGEVEISDKEALGLLETLELELLESDVAFDVAEEIKEDLRTALTGRKIKRGELNSFVKSTIRGTLTRLMTSDKEFDILDVVRKTEKPAKIVFVGINGAGKTTTMAKVARLLMDNKMSVVFASADTFRAAAIEQMQVHADRLGVRNIKRDYGSDPAAVAYDAVNYAKAHNVDAVLIDTAGRQETDLNLINELKKMNRVIKPDLKIYIGESIAGNGIISQVSDFNEAIGVDGVILTKLDCDAKGGTVLSVTKSTGIPIIYIGTGQGYHDLEHFEAEKIIERILG